METYVALLRSSAALFAVKPDLNRQDWHTYTSKLNLERNFLGLQALAFAPHIPERQREALEKKNLSRRLSWLLYSPSR